MLDNAIEPLTDLLPPTATTLAVTTATMNVVELAGPHALRLARRTIPDTPADGVLMKTLTTSICSTDVSFVEGNLYPDAYPIVLGHEYLGKVIDIGPDLAAEGSVQVGDRVVYWGQTDYDGFAEYRTLRPVFANQRKTDEFTADRYFTDDHRAAAVVIPPSLPDIGASLLEPTTGVMRSLLGNPPGVGDRVLILGAGPIGIIAGRLLSKSFATSRVVVLDSNVARNARAETLFADQAVTLPELKHIDLDYFDYVFDCLPTINSADEEHDPRRVAMRRLRPGGRYVLYGASQQMQKFDTWLLLAKGIKMTSSPFDVRAFPMHRTAAVIKAALHAVLSGVVNVSDLVTHVHPILGLRRSGPHPRELPHHHRSEDGHRLPGLNSPAKSRSCQRPPVGSQLKPPSGRPSRGRPRRLLPPVATRLVLGGKRRLLTSPD